MHNFVVLQCFTVLFSPACLPTAYICYLLFYFLPALGVLVLCSVYKLTDPPLVPDSLCIMTFCPCVGIQHNGEALRSAPKPFVLSQCTSSFSAQNKRSGITLHPIHHVPLTHHFSTIQEFILAVI